MIRRVLGWLLPAGGPVVEQVDPQHQAAFEAREAEIAEINADIRVAFERGDGAAVDALLDKRNALRAGRPRVRPAIPEDSR